MHQMKLWYLIIQYSEFCLIKEINFGLQQLKSSLAVCTKNKNKRKNYLIIKNWKAVRRIECYIKKTLPSSGKTLAVNRNLSF